MTLKFIPILIWSILALFPLENFGNPGLGNGNGLIINGNILTPGIDGQIQLVCYYNYLQAGLMADTKVYTATIHQGKFHFEIRDIPRLTYYQIIFPEALTKALGWALNDKVYLIPHGTVVSIVIDGTHLSFKGSLTSLLNAQYQYQDVAYNLPSGQSGIGQGFLEARHTAIDSARKEQLAILDRFLEKISPFYYEVLKTDIICKSLFIELSSYSSLRTQIDFHSIDSNCMKKLDLANGYYGRFVFQTKVNSSDQRAKERSFYYSRAVLEKEFDDQFFLLNQKEDLAGLNNYSPRLIGNIFQRLIDKYKGRIRDRLLAAIFNRNSYYGDANLYIQRALASSRNVKYKRFLEEVYNSLGAGATVNNFTLTDTSGRRVSLDKFDGRLVIVDFWFTGCENCIFLRKAMEPVYKKYLHDDRIAFLSISIDKDENTWKKSVRQGLYSDPISTNLYTDGLGEEAPIIKYYRIKGFPTLFVIKRKKMISANPPRPNLINDQPTLNGNTRAFIDLIEKYI